MGTTKTLVWCSLLLCACSSTAKSPERLSGAEPAAAGRGSSVILGLREFDEDGGATDLGGSVFFIDSNSRIEVLLDKQALRAAIPQDFVPTGISDELERLVRVQREAAAGLAGIEALARASAAYAENPSRVEALQAALTPVAESAIPLLERVTEPGDPMHALEAEYNAMVESDQAGVGGYRGLFELAERYAATELARLDAQLSQEHFAILLEARLLQQRGSANVHLEGFDGYPTGEYMRVARWHVAPSAADQQQLEQLKGVADRLDEGGVSPGELLRTIARNLLEGLVADGKQALDQLEKGLAELVKQGAQALAPEQARFEALRSEAKGVLAFLEALKLRYLGGDPASLDPAKWLRDLQDLAGKLETLQTHATEWLESLRSRVDGLDAAIQELRSQVVTLVSESIGPLRKRALDFSDAVGITSAAERTVRSLGEYGDKVLRHSLQSLPERTELALLTTGAREVGDGLLFRIGCARVDPRGEAAAVSTRTLEQRRFELAQVLIHSETAATLSFLNPKGSASINREWQTVPAFSVLLKRDSRTSGLYNRILDPGIGLSLAAPDFDGDDAPEVGLGLVLSLFHDYLQAGYGYDISEDRWYWSIGVGLPLSALVGAGK